MNLSESQNMRLMNADYKVKGQRSELLQTKKIAVLTIFHLLVMNKTLLTFIIFISVVCHLNRNITESKIIIIVSSRSLTR